MMFFKIIIKHLFVFDVEQEVINLTADRAAKVANPANREAEISKISKISNSGTEKLTFDFLVDKIANYYSFTKDEITELHNLASIIFRYPIPYYRARKKVVMTRKKVAFKICGY